MARKRGGRATTWARKVKRDCGYRCIICRSQIDIHAHHIWPVSRYPELEDVIENGVCLCAECHFQCGGDADPPEELRDLLAVHRLRRGAREEFDVECYAAIMRFFEEMGPLTDESRPVQSRKRGRYKNAGAYI
jgi:hypothetical protein